jgi:tetratricopeptide (TPR) repeat protein
MAEQDKDQAIDITETIDRAENYVQENKKSLAIIGGTIVVVVGGYLGYTNFIVKPQEENAQKQMFVAERYFQNDSLDLAINGDGMYPGFAKIIDDYGSSNSANLAHYYLGISYLKKGQYDKAIEYLSKYDAEDDITGAIALGGIGDANLELGKNDEALKYYKKAADWDENSFTAPLYLKKTATVYELQNDYKSALEVYQRIQKDYPTSTEGRDVERLIAHAEGMIK